MKHDDLVRLWFGAVRAAADEGEKEVPEDLKLSPLQKAKLHILTRQDLSDFLWLSIRSTEDLSTEAADSVWEDMYSGLMEDAIAGIWSEQENLELAQFMRLCEIKKANPDYAIRRCAKMALDEIRGEDGYTDIDALGEYAAMHRSWWLALAKGDATDADASATEGGAE